MARELMSDLRRAQLAAMDDLGADDETPGAARIDAADILAHMGDEETRFVAAMTDVYEEAVTAAADTVARETREGPGGVRLAAPADRVVHAPQATKVRKIVKTVRDALLAIPDNVAAVLAAESNEDAVRELLVREVTNVLRNLSDTFAKRA